MKNAKAAKKRQERQEKLAMIAAISLAEALIKFDPLPPKQLLRPWRFLAVLAFLSVDQRMSIRKLDFPVRNTSNN